MAPPKRICLTGKTCSVGKVQKSLCYGQSVLHSSELDVHGREGRETCTSCCCAEFSINSGISRFGAKPTIELRQQGPGAGEPRGNQEPGKNQKESESPRATVVPAAYPKFFFVQNTIFHCISFF